MLKKLVQALICFSLYFGLPTQKLSAAVPNLDLVDSVTAVTLPRASYDIALTAYANGSMQMKAILALHDNFYLGASFDTENIIGNGDVQVHIPGVIAKLKLTNGWESFPLLVAFGYDSFYLGDNGRVEDNPNPLARIIYGPYVALSKPIFLLGGEQHLHLGVRMPVQPNYVPGDTALYLGFDFPMGFLIPMFELNRVYFSGGRLEEVLFNLGFKLNIVENFSLELNFLFGLQENIGRVIVLEYVNFF